MVVRHIAFAADEEFSIAIQRPYYIIATRAAVNDSCCSTYCAGTVNAIVAACLNKVILVAVTTGASVCSVPLFCAGRRCYYSSIVMYVA